MSLVKIDDKQIEYVWYGPGPADAATLVFLHEGLGSVSLWRDFPRHVSQATGCGALVYSRLGYGASDQISLPRLVRFMHDEALVMLPQIFQAFSIQRAILVGHSDGASIGIIYAGGVTENRVAGLILEAPHVFVESIGLESIRSIRAEYREGDLRSRLEKYHGSNVDNAFWGWNEVWLDPAFASWNIEEYLPQIRVPVLVIQGTDDQYGTWAQVEAIEKRCEGLVETIRMEQCGHAPHVDQPELTLPAITDFVTRVLKEV
jgi:pimeloyl-ACP methyl ester carboxylesterase